MVINSASYSTWLTSAAAAPLSVNYKTSAGAQLVVVRAEQSVSVAAMPVPTLRISSSRVIDSDFGVARSVGAGRRGTARPSAYYGDTVSLEWR